MLHICETCQQIVGCDKSWKQIYNYMYIGKLIHNVLCGDFWFILTNFLLRKKKKKMSKKFTIMHLISYLFITCIYYKPKISIDM